MTLLEHLDAMAFQIYDLADAAEDALPLATPVWLWATYCRFSNSAQLGIERRREALEVLERGRVRP